MIDSLGGNHAFVPAIGEFKNGRGEFYDQETWVTLRDV
jgi:hypothetical protein